MTGEPDRGSHERPHDPIEGIVGMVLGAATVGTSALTSVNRPFGLALTAVAALVSVWLVVHAPVWLHRVISVLRRVRFSWVVLTSFCLLIAFSIPTIVASAVFREDVAMFREQVGLNHTPPDGTAVDLGDVTAGDLGDFQNSMPAALGDEVSAEALLREEGSVLPAGAAYIAWDAGTVGDSAIVVRIWLESSSGQHLTNWKDGVINVTQGAPHGRARLESVAAAGMEVKFIGGSTGSAYVELMASAPLSGRLALPAQPAAGVQGEVIFFSWRVTLA